ITNSEFRHGPGVTNMLGQYRNQAPPPVRDEFSNNLVWDIGGYADSYQQSGHGWIFQATGGEDMTISHNTILPLRGWLSTVFYAYGSMPNEGYKVTDNIFPASNTFASSYGFYGQECPNAGESMLSCSTSPWA